jgi:hypothetical protein
MVRTIVIRIQIRAAGAEQRGDVVKPTSSISVPSRSRNTAAAPAAPGRGDAMELMTPAAPRRPPNQR